jgi:hypothetical protein
MCRKLGFVCFILPVALLVSLGGCPTGNTDNGTTDGNQPAANEEAQLQVNFNPEGGNYAVATDKDGNQYSFRAHQEGGDTIITEANIKKPSGKELKVSLDEAGRPVNLRGSDNTAADLVYGENETVKIRVTDATGQQTAAGTGIKTNTMKEVVQQRRAENFSKAAARFQGKSEKLDTLQKGLATCEEVVAAITDPETNPESPLANSSLSEDLLSVGGVASTGNVDEVDERDELDATIDEVPAAIQALAGQTYILFDAEGFCIAETQVANRLTFDSNGVLMSEFDRRLVFPDLSLNQGADSGITINYQSLTELILTPDEIGFDLTVTPIFTGTQLDDAGNITIERRFNAVLLFPAELVGEVTAKAEQLFDAALINGVLKADDTGDESGILEIDLVLVDLQEDNPVVQVGALRYYKQGIPKPAAIYPCEQTTEEQQQDDPERGISCPGTADVWTEFDIAFNPGSASTSDFQYDWYVSSGAGYISGGAGAATASFVGTDSGPLEVTLLLHDMSDDPAVVGVYSCTINIGGEGEQTPTTDGLNGYCPSSVVIYEPFECWVEGSLLPDLVAMDWFVMGTWAYDISDPFGPQTMITFYETGAFQVAFEAWTESGEYIYLWQDVQVSDSGEVDWDEEPPVTDASALAGDYQGDLVDPPEWAQEIYLTILDDGTVEGWVIYSGGAEYNLYGGVSEDGYIYFENDAADYGYAVGIYEGYWGVTPIGEEGFVGIYYDGDWSNPIGEWAVIPVSAF